MKVDAAQCGGRKRRENELRQRCSSIDERAGCIKQHRRYASQPTGTDRPTDRVQFGLALASGARRPSADQLSDHRAPPPPPGSIKVTIVWY